MRRGELLAAAELAPLDELQQARLERLRAAYAFNVRRRSDALPLLLAAARRLEPLDAALARETYLDALGAAIFADRPGSDRGMRKAGAAARAAPPGPQPPRPIDLLLDGLAIRFTDGYTASVPALRRALDVFEDDRQRAPREGGLRWLWLGWPVASDIWDDAALDSITSWAVGTARDRGELTLLPVALLLRAGADIFAGAFDAASLVDEATTITHEIGVYPLTHVAVALAAWRGRVGRASELIESAIADATAREEGQGITLAEYARALLYNGLGRYENALGAAERSCESEALGLFGWALVELIEAAARCGRRDVGTTALRRLEERTSVAATDWALGTQARSRALLSDGAKAEALYREALERLARDRVVVFFARAQLVYGEWLRREGRRVDARVQLRAAYERFSDMGAEGFTERARRELAATGERVGKRSVGTRDELTAQETQIARLAANGLSNAEIGAQLFISYRTVEWHLKKIFAKLDITSRKQIGEALAAGGRAVSA
jgi:DNA-binding CsgD family transcriptional regulator